MQGVTEREGVVSRRDARIERGEVEPGVLLWSVLGILVDCNHDAIDLEDHVLMILVLIASGIPRTAAFRVTFHDVAEEHGCRVVAERERIGVRHRLFVAAQQILEVANE